MSCRFLLERISYQNNSWTFPNAQDFVRISYKTTHRTFVFCVPTTNPPHFDPTFVPKPKELLPVDPSALRATRLWHLPRRAGGWRCHDSSSVAATENAHDSLPDAKGSHHHLSGAAMAFVVELTQPWHDDNFRYYWLVHITRDVPSKRPFWLGQVLGIFPYLKRYDWSTRDIYI